MLRSKGLFFCTQRCRAPCKPVSVMAPSRPQQMTGVALIKLSHVVRRLTVLSCTNSHDPHWYTQIRGTTLAVAHPLEQSSKAAVPALISRESVQQLEVSLTLSKFYICTVPISKAWPGCYTCRCILTPAPAIAGRAGQWRVHPGPPALQ